MTEDQNDKIKQEINKAINFLGQNKFDEAEKACKKILDTGDSPDAYHILSSIKIYKQEYDESIDYVMKSIKINDTNPGYHVTLGCAYSSKQDYVKSVEAFKNALKINSKIAQVHFYLGESYRKLKQYNNAISSFYDTIELAPDHTGAHMLLGIVYQEKKQFDLSINSFKKCIDIMPDYAEAHVNLGLCYLLIGDYDNGWREYEWRRKLFKTNEDKLQKEWTGQSLENKTLLVIDEESTDNLIHFVRFLKELKREGCKIILQCNQQSQTLMSQQSWIDNVVDHEHYPDHDYYVQIGSIMNILKFNPNHHEQLFPYLKINDKPSDLTVDDNLNIGIIWEANRDSSAHDDNSINSELFERIFKEHENVICLDKEINKDNKPDFVNKVAEYSDLLELAQLIKQLDVVLTVDHTIVHLAGALDINTILMLPCIPNWRWDMNHRNTSPWYKSLKIYRQQMPGDWSYVLNKVSKSLLEMKNG